MEFSKSQSVILKDMALHASPEYMAKMIDEKIFEKLDISLADYLKEISDENKPKLITHYATSEIMQIIVDNELDYIKELTHDLELSSFKILKKIISKSSIPTERLKYIVDNTAFIDIIVESIKCNNVEVNNYIANFPIEELDFKVQEALAEKCSDIIHKKIASCKNAETNSTALLKVAINCLPSLHSTILSSPHIDTSIRHVIE